MTRDHLLGCRQYIPDVENGESVFAYRKMVSVRQEEELEAKWAVACPPRDPALTVFETGDWQPPVDGQYEVREAKKPHIRRDWGLSWFDLNREYIDALLLSPRVKFYVDPAKIDLDMTSFEPYRVWSAAEMAPKNQTATEVRLKMEAARFRPRWDAV
jgi:hypothetical protein